MDKENSKVIMNQINQMQALISSPKSQMVLSQKEFTFERPDSQLIDDEGLVEAAKTIDHN